MPNNPEQKLLLVTYDIDPDEVSLGDNTVSVSLTQLAHPYLVPVRSNAVRRLQVEKVELHITQ